MQRQKSFFYPYMNGWENIYMDRMYVCIYIYIYIYILHIITRTSYHQRICHNFMHSFEITFSNMFRILKISVWHIYKSYTVRTDVSNYIYFRNCTILCINISLLMLMFLPKFLYLYILNQYAALKNLLIFLCYMQNIQILFDLALCYAYKFSNNRVFYFFDI